MSKDETPPFPRGGTLFAGSPTSGDVVSGGNFCGKEWRFEDTTYNTNMYVTVRAVRNTASINLLPSRMCSFDPAYPMNAINGYTDVSYAPGVVLDEFLPTAGVVPYDIAFVILEGPTLMLTALDGGADNVISFLDPIAAITAATTGATTAGRVATANTSGSTTSQRDSLLNVVGRALSAATTGNTNKLLLVNANRWF